MFKKITRGVFMINLFKNIDFSKMYLCFADRGELWFTDKKAKDVWGDDWNDIPLEHNAGEPYVDRCRHSIEIMVADDSDMNDNKYQLMTFDQIMDNAGIINSDFSAEILNKDKIFQWAEICVLDRGSLITKEKFYADTPLDQFIDALRCHNIEFESFYIEE